ncbi:hypothetical protein JIN77_12500 [Verrucomicrobiaceae bacterium R5-34]|uniref:Uncharacterized protein n=1 Tax=Oceaniferula flava TaxID=2800421 RepID=A0AAE2SAQ8_9BACT|nr:hypothetical protein [Oceaniferula flavus]MBK1831552.1 hypothetical protein [Verrucomicrobiaceae bacterium R5-34]MBK1854209.1 hypothetical protein [Oceaniferula flavus]MBM1135515.1 hypothetical protein [Oceaniferula flavus]
MLTQKLFALSCLALIFNSASLGAQEDGTAAADKRQEEKNLSGFRVSLFSEWGGKQLYVKGRKGDFRELKAYKMSYTQKFPFAKDQPITLFTKVERPDAEPVYTPYLTVKKPVDVVEPLLILYWSKQLKKGSAQVLEFSPRRFKYGSYQVVNLGATPVLGYVQDKKNRFLCAPKKSVINSYSVENGTVIPIEMITKIGDEPKVVYSSVVKHIKQRRMIFFIYPQTKASGKVQYRTQVMEDYFNE